MIKTTLIVIAAVAMSFSYGYSLQPTPQIIKQPVIVETQVPVCNALPDPKHANKYRSTLDMLAAAIPERALKP
jgi:hypothetical protein